MARLPFRTWQGLALCAVLLLGGARHAMAWGPQGHQLTADIAAQLIQGSRAERELAQVLGPLTLRDISVWADCAKGVAPRPDFRYSAFGRYPECAVFESPPEIALMRDYVMRNLDACRTSTADEPCHKQYHYADVALQREHYRRGLTGTHDHDVVAALQAAIAVLQGRPSPPPLSLANRREALALLVHLVGDIHQPLHMGALYLDAQGQALDPDALGLRGAALDAASNRGGNVITLPGGNLHTFWDLSPRLLTLQDLAALPDLARQVPADSGPPSQWPLHWADESLLATRAIYLDVSLSASHSNSKGPQWAATLPGDYAQRSRDITRQQLARAGARLAELLRALWPDPSP